MSMHTIDQAKNMRNGINLEGEVVRKGETRTVSKKTGGTIDVCDAYLKDSANEEIKITLWAEDIEKISQGAKIKITNGFRAISYYVMISISQIVLLPFLDLFEDRLIGILVADIVGIAVVVLFASVKWGVLVRERRLRFARPHIWKF